jgi:hypothetical protein
VHCQTNDPKDEQNDECPEKRHIFDPLMRWKRLALIPLPVLVSQ